MRKFEKRKYVIAFIITLAIFLLGFFLGFVMDLQRVNYFQEITDKQKLDLTSLQLQYELAQEEPFSESCGAFEVLFQRFMIDLEDNRIRIDNYYEQADVKKEDFQNLKREYMISQIKFWQISRNLKKFCPQNYDFVTVIYFYSDDSSCADCSSQANVLDYYKRVLKDNILIFSIDETFKDREPIIELFKATYNITQYPTLIINVKAYSPLMDKTQLKEILCREYSSPDVKQQLCE